MINPTPFCSPPYGEGQGVGPVLWKNINYNSSATSPLRGSQSDWE